MTGLGTGIDEVLNSLYGCSGGGAGAYTIRLSVNAAEIAFRRDIEYRGYIALIQAVAGAEAGSSGIIINDGV